MDVDGLETFLAVHRQRGFSSAARVLHRTQPAISRRVRLLEDELGAPLFERAAGRVVLSEAGRVLLPHAERALAAVGDARAAVEALRTGEAGSLTVAIVGTLAGPPLTAALRGFAAAHPGVALELRTARSAEVSELVRRGDAAIGVRYERDRARELRCEELLREPLVVVCAPDHPLAGRRVAALRRLRDERWLAFPEIPGQRELAAAHVFGVFLARGLGEVTWTPIDSLTAQKRLVEAGLGIALMTASSVVEERAAGTLAAIRVRDLDAAMPVYVVTRAGGYLGAAGQALLGALRAAHRR